MPTHDMREPIFALLRCVIAAGLLLACGDDGHAAGIGTGAGPDEDDSDGGSLLGPSEPARGNSPRWPSAETDVVLPYRGGDVTADLIVGADLDQLDVHINVDTTGSFGEEIAALQRTLRTQILSTLSRRVDHVSVGVSRFADFPIHPFGHTGSPPAGDQPYALLTPITSDLYRVGNAVTRLNDPLGYGGDEKEASGEALYQIATGVGYEDDGERYIAPWDGMPAAGGGNVGGVGFRPQALKVVVHVTDALSHTAKDYAEKELVGVRGLSDAASALRAIGARVIGIMSTSCGSDECRAPGSKYAELRAELSELARHTLAVMDPDADMCPTGIEGALVPTYQDDCPLVFDVRANGTGLADTVIDALLSLLDRLRFAEVHAVPLADPLGFLQSIVAIAVEQPPGMEAPRRVDRQPKGAPDGRKDTFLAVQKRHRLGFRLTLRNDHIPPGPSAQRFRVSIRVMGDGVALEERTLRVVIPKRAAHPTPAQPDAAVDAAMDAAIDTTADSGLDDDAGP
jgi:hypothetical protein